MLQIFNTKSYSTKSCFLCVSGGWTLARNVMAWGPSLFSTHAHFVLPITSSRSSESKDKALREWAAQTRTRWWDLLRRFLRASGRKTRLCSSFEYLKNWLKLFSFRKFILFSGFRCLGRRDHCRSSHHRVQRQKGRLFLHPSQELLQPGKPHYNFLTQILTKSLQPFKLKFDLVLR